MLHTQVEHSAMQEAASAVELTTQLVNDLAVQVRVFVLQTSLFWFDLGARQLTKATPLLHLGYTQMHIVHACSKILCMILCIKQEAVRA